MIGELAPGQHHPFPMASAENNWQGTMIYSIVSSSPCVVPSSTPSTSGGDAA